jgi:hypothetical protein
MNLNVFHHGIERDLLPLVRTDFHILPHIKPCSTSMRLRMVAQASPLLTNLVLYLTSYSRSVLLGRTSSRLQPQAANSFPELRSQLEWVWPMSRKSDLETRYQCPVPSSVPAFPA